jgi:integrase
MSQWKRTDSPGITYKVHESRKYGIGRDKYFRGQYQCNGRRRTIGFGWLSEGWTESQCSMKLQEYKRNAKYGDGPTTLKEELRIKREKEKRALEKRKKMEAKNITFAAFFNDKYLPHAKQSKKPSSWKKEVSFFNNWINDTFGSKTINRITAIDLEALKGKMMEAGKAPKTIHYCLSTVRQVFNWAIALEFYEKINPIKTIKLPRLNNKRDRFLTRAEADRLLEALRARSVDLHDMALLSLHCGLRAGEIFALRWEHVSLAEKTLTVRDGKGDKDRVVYMSTAVHAMLEARKAGSAHALVFPAREGQQRGWISKVFRNVVNELGLNDGRPDRRDRVVFHTLRHTFASWQVQAGLPLYELQHLLGHASLDMVQRYAHLAPENLKRATAIFDNPTNKILSFPPRKYAK